MLYEVITLRRTIHSTYERDRQLHRMVAQYQPLAADRKTPAGESFERLRIQRQFFPQELTALLRITSYNVCYTKLLRCAAHAPTFFHIRHFNLRQSPRAIVQQFPHDAAPDPRPGSRPRPRAARGARARAGP